MRTRSKAKTVEVTGEEGGEETLTQLPTTKISSSSNIDAKNSTQRDQNGVRRRNKTTGEDSRIKPSRRMPSRSKGLLPSMEDQIALLSTKFPNTVPASHPDTPEYAKYTYIEQGYRVGYTLYECLLSLFTFHNESLNIWTHLLALIAWIALFAFYASDYIHTLTTIPLPSSSTSSSSSSSSSSYVNDMGLYGLNGTDTDFLLLTMYMFVGGCVYFFSVVYHTFGCLDQPCHDCLLKFDLMGICILLFGSYFPFFFYAFHCRPSLQQFYLNLTLCTIPAGSMVAWFGGGASEKEFWTRTLGFTFLTVVGIVPNIHLTLITPSSWLSLQPYILAMFTSYGTGLFFYVSKVPEVVLPSFVNRTFFTSHVMWHFGVIAGITVWGVALLKAQSLMRSETCDSWDL